MKYLLLILLSTKIYADVIYTKDIKPIFEKRCILCHGPNNPNNLPNWLDYKTAYEKRLLIRERVVIKKEMPLGFSMPQEERDLVEQWIKEGAKE